MLQIISTLKQLATLNRTEHGLILIQALEAVEKKSTPTGEDTSNELFDFQVTNTFDAHVQQALKKVYKRVLAKNNTSLNSDALHSLFMKELRDELFLLDTAILHTAADEVLEEVMRHQGDHRSGDPNRPTTSRKPHFAPTQNTSPPFSSRHFTPKPQPRHTYITHTSEASTQSTSDPVSTKSLETSTEDRIVEVPRPVEPTPSTKGSIYSRNPTNLGSNALKIRPKAPKDLTSLLMWRSTSRKPYFTSRPKTSTPLSNQHFTPRPRMHVSTHASKATTITSRHPSTSSTKPTKVIQNGTFEINFVK